MRKWAFIIVLIIGAFAFGKVKAISCDDQMSLNQLPFCTNASVMPWNGRILYDPDNPSNSVHLYYESATDTCAEHGYMAGSMQTQQWYFDSYFGSTTPNSLYDPLWIDDGGCYVKETQNTIDYSNAECSVWQNKADCDWEGQPPSGVTEGGTGKCTWNGPASATGSYCEDAAGITSFGTDEPSLNPLRPVDCQTNYYNATSGAYTVELRGNFWNPPVCTGSLTFCQEHNLTFWNIRAVFWAEDNSSSSILLLASSTANSVSGYGTATTSLTSAPYRLEYQATSTDENGTLQQWLWPSDCLTFVTDNDHLTIPEILQRAGTNTYLDCQNAYNACMASSTSFLENAVCGIQGAFWSLFCPNPETLARLKGIPNDAKGRFPLTLARAFMTISGSYASTIESTSSATTTYIGADLSWTDTVKSIGFFQVVRTLMTAVITILFGVLFLKYAMGHFFAK